MEGERFRIPKKTVVEEKGVSIKRNTCAGAESERLKLSRARSRAAGGKEEGR